MDFKFVNLKQRTPEWLEWRRTYVCASDAPIIMGESKFKTLRELYDEKNNGIESVCTHSMQRGTDLEPIALEWLNFQLGPPFFLPAVIESTIHERFGASLDAIRFVDGKVEVAEIKSPGEKDHLEAIAGNVPLHYKAQLQHIMVVLGTPFCRYLSFDGTNGVILNVPRDIEYQKAMIDKERAFLAILDAHEPPEICGKDVTEINDLEAKEVAKKYLELSQTVKGLEEEIENLKKLLISYSKSDYTLIGPILLRREERKGNIDYMKAIPSNVDLELFRKPTSITWKIVARKENNNG
jgi:putative phage-type endonuclease